MLAAIAVGTYFGVSSSEISMAIAGYTPKNNRSQLLQTNDNTLIVDAYNANPSSMMAALQNFQLVKGESKSVILGEMRELGADSREEHQKIVEYLSTCQFESVYLVGSEFMSANHDYPTFERVSDLIIHLQANKPHENTILIKGSNGVKLTEVIDFL